MTAILTGDKALDRNLKMLGGKPMVKVSHAGVRAGLRVIAKGIKSEIPPHMKSARKSVSSRFAKAKRGANKGIIQAKVGNVGPQIRKGNRVGAETGRGNKPGVGIGRANLHWVLMGTKQRNKKATISATSKTAGASTGVMPAIGAVPRGFAKSKDAARRKITENIKKGIAREAAKK